MAKTFPPHRPRWPLPSGRKFPVKHPNVTEWGAVADSGSTNNSTALTNAIAARNAYEVVIIPQAAGYYGITSTFDHKSGVGLVGHEAEIFTPYNDGGFTMCDISGMTRPFIGGVRFKSASNGVTVSSVYPINTAGLTYGATFHDLHVVAVRDGIKFGGLTDRSILRNWDVKIRGFIAEAVGQGMNIRSTDRFELRDFKVGLRTYGTPTGHGLYFETKTLHFTVEDGLIYDVIGGYAIHYYNESPSADCTRWGTTRNVVIGDDVRKALALSNVKDLGFYNVSGVTNIHPWAYVYPSQTDGDPSSNLIFQDCSMKATAPSGYWMQAARSQVCVDGLSVTDSKYNASSGKYSSTSYIINRTEDAFDYEAL